MTRATRAALALLGALALTFGFAGTATAQPAPTCDEATNAVAGAEERFGFADAQLAEFRTQYAAAVAALDALPTFAEAQAEVERLTLSVELNENQVAGIEAEIATLEAAVPVDAAAVAEAEGRLAIAEAQLAAVEANLAAAVVVRDGAQAAIDAAQAEVDRLALEVTVNENQVAGIQAELDAALLVQAELCPAPTPTDTATPTPTDTVTPGPSETAAPSPMPTVVPAAVAARGGTLPRTGSNDLIPIGAAGFLALLTGAGLAWKFRNRLGITGGEGGTTL